RAQRHFNELGQGMPARVDGADEQNIPSSGQFEPLNPNGTRFAHGMTDNVVGNANPGFFLGPPGPRGGSCGSGFPWHPCLPFCTAAPPPPADSERKADV